MSQGTASALASTDAEKTDFSGSTVRDAIDNSPLGTTSYIGPSGNCFVALSDDSKGQGALNLTLTVGSVIAVPTAGGKVGQEEKRKDKVDTRSVTFSCKTAPSIKVLARSLSDLAMKYIKEVNGIAEHDSAYFGGFPNEGLAESMMILLAQTQIVESFQGKDGWNSSYAEGLKLGQSLIAKQVRRFLPYFAWKDRGSNVISTLSEDRDGSVFLGMCSTFEREGQGDSTNASSPVQNLKISFDIGRIKDSVSFSSVELEDHGGLNTEKLCVPVKALVDAVLTGRAPGSVQFSLTDQDRSLLEKWSRDPRSAVSALKDINYRSGDDTRARSTFRTGYVKDMLL